VAILTPTIRQVRAKYQSRLIIERMNIPNIRPMNINDLDAVLAIEQSVQAFPWSRAMFSDSLESGYLAFVLETDDEIVGYVLGEMLVDEGYIYNIAVRPSQQGAGLGYQLMRTFLEKVREEGAVACLLEVRVSNEQAWNFYQRQGFSEIARRHDYYPTTTGREDAIIARLKLV
jgi:[ribosomal protein S18]-alanine N-acetyltransferase